MFTIWYGRFAYPDVYQQYRDDGSSVDTLEHAHDVLKIALVKIN